MKVASNLRLSGHKKPQTGTSLVVQRLTFCASNAQVGDAIQPSHPLLPPFPPALNLSQYRGLFQ